MNNSSLHFQIDAFQYYKSVIFYFVKIVVDQAFRITGILNNSIQFIEIIIFNLFRIIQQPVKVRIAVQILIVLL